MILELPRLSNCGRTNLVSNQNQVLESYSKYLRSSLADYDPTNPQPSHFTQVVWKSSTQLGCAVKACSGIFAASDGVSFSACLLIPAGLKSFYSWPNITLVNTRHQATTLESLREFILSIFPKKRAILMDCMNTAKMSRFNDITTSLVYFFVLTSCISFFFVESLYTASVFHIWNGITALLSFERVCDNHENSERTRTSYTC